MPEYKASIWMERFLKLTKDYEPADNWMNMDETGWFFKALPEKGLAEKKVKQEGVKNPKLD